MTNMNYGEMLSRGSKSVLRHAELLANVTRSQFIDTAHLLLSLLLEGDATIEDVINKFNISYRPISQKLRIDDLDFDLDVNETKKMPLSEVVGFVVESAINIARDHGSDKCEPIHMLFSLLGIRDSVARNLLADQELNYNEIGQYIHDNIFDKDDYSLDGDSDSDEETGIGHEKRTKAEKQSILKKYTRDLTSLAVEGKLDPVIGRQKELDRLISILGRRTKNNPILVGEAGVGKTAVVEGLAHRLANKNVPDFLRNKKIFELDLASLVAGTRFRGDFEERLTKLISVVENNDDIIIFIDEIHLLVGSGGAEGSMDAANILKPALARGEFRLIGATTNDEYRKKIEKDAALARRLQAIEVSQPTDTDTVKILTGIAPKYEEYHGVKFSEDAISDIVKLSSRYMSNKFQPDKAIDVMDETAVHVVMASQKNRPGPMDKIDAITNNINTLTLQMENAVEKEDYELAATNKMRISQLKEKLEELQNEQATTGRMLNIKLADIAETIHDMTGIPSEQLKKSEMSKLMNLEKHLAARIIGQDKAISIISRSIRRARAGIANNKKPIGSFIFLGPTGVGKTELARVLADEVFGSIDNLIKLDMSEFSEKHNVARLIGAPAGYVGYDDGGQLTDRVRRQPYSIILFDEIEKAHPDVFNVLLQIMEDGVLTDGHGVKVDFRNCVIILTSNIGAAELSTSELGFGGSNDEAVMQNGRSSKVIKALQRTMRPELINRFDDVIVFDGLSKDDVSRVCDLLLNDLKQRLMEKGISVTFLSTLRKYLVANGYNVKYGARPMRRLIQDAVESPLADQIISGKLKHGHMIKLGWHDDKLTINRTAEKTNNVIDGSADTKVHIVPPKRVDE